MDEFDPDAYLAEPDVLFTAKATGYHPVDPGHPEYKMEGGREDRVGNPVYTLDQYRRGEAPYVTVAVDKKALPYGAELYSPQFPGVKFRATDTGSAFRGKGLSRVDIARDTSVGANSNEVNQHVDFTPTPVPVDLQETRIEKAKPVKIQELQVARAKPVESFNPDKYLSAQPAPAPTESFNPDAYSGETAKPKPAPALDPSTYQGLSPEEEGQMLQKFAQDHPFLEGIANSVTKFIPKSIGSAADMARYMTMPFTEAPKAIKQAYDVISGKPIEEAIPESQPLKKLEEIKKQFGGGSPEYQKAAGEAAGQYIGQVLTAAGVPGIYKGVAAAGAVAAAKEAIAKPVEPAAAPEAPPPAPEVPRAFAEPTVARAQAVQTADITRTILDRRNELMAEAQQLGEQAVISQKMGQRVHPAIEARLAEINSEMNQPAIGATNPLEDSGPSVMVPSEQTGRVAVSPVSTTPGDIAVGQQPSRQEVSLGVGERPGVGEPRGLERFDPDEYLSETVDPRTGISNKAFQAVYGKGEIPSATGRGPAAWKQLGDQRLARGDDPYAAIAKARQTGIMEPEDLALVRAEHKRLVGDARAAEGTPLWEEKSRFATDVADAIQQTAKGPASDVFRGLQEWDEPTFDNLTDFDQIVRKRQGKEMDATQRSTFQRIANDVKSTSEAARSESDVAVNRIRNYRPKETISFEDATKNLHDQITKLTADCIL